MAESITISRTPPDFKSMQYDFLRGEGLKHIERLAGKIWTDYNLSDPGISIMEVLSYVITDLGYRSAYPIKDIIAQDPDAAPVDIKNFYTARQILPMAPVTFNDYRKLLIDTDVHNPADTGAEFVGVKNAWIDISPETERAVYIQRALDKLGYDPEVTASPEKVDIKVLYNVLLELDSCEKFGDLNENTLEGIVTISAPTTPINLTAFSGLKVKVKVNVEFPRWDDETVDWNDLNSIRSKIRNVTLTFPKLPAGYKLDGYGLFPDKTVWISITQLPIAAPLNPSFIEIEIDDLLYTGASSLIKLYQAKVKKILDIVAAVRARLMANRNLCEDFFKISALKIEDIAVCADIELTADADVEETLAKIYFEIGKFLAPTVYFYTLEEMYDKGKRTEEIFEGPALNHGFIDEDELIKAGRRKVIHVSDLIHIIMELPGVVAVKSIQVANIPEDNVDHIASVSVRWCLDLAFDHNYVPRLSTDLSKITFYKDLLPFKANSDEVDALLAEMEANDRPQKIEDAVLDLPVPAGEYKNIEEYVSVQDEFPLNYGIGPEGLPDSAPDLRKAQAKQLKGFLMFFDQLLADYLSQLAHVKDLFSMNEARDASGDFIIDKSYFTQSLVPSVSGATELLVDPAFYPDHLQDITEDATLFDQRRNKFLDHLMARFSEQFTDYAMLVYKLDGKKAPQDLLQDKLEVLNAYPEISGGRFKGFNYESPCSLWSVDNVSGLEKRVSLLTGINPRKADDLFFNSNFQVVPVGSDYGYMIIDSSGTEYLLQNAGTFSTINAWQLGMEKVIINGVNRERYQVVDANNVVMEPLMAVTPVPPYTYRLVCGAGEILGLSTTTYTTTAMAEDDIEATIATIAPEFYNNIESNRNNLSAPISDYTDTGVVVVNMVPDPPTYTFDFTLYHDPFNFTSGATELLTGTYTGQGLAKASQGIYSVDDIAAKKITLVGDFTEKIFVGDAVTIKDSDLNDGDYTVTDVQPVALSPFTATQITLSGGPATLSTNVPIGTLYYNTQTLAQLTEVANANIQQVLFDILMDGTKINFYTYDDLTGDYRFNIGDRCGDTLATSVESNFNDAMADAVLTHSGGNTPAGAVEISGLPLSNNGTYAVLSASADKDLVKVTVPVTLLPVAGGQLFFDGTYTVIDMDRYTRVLVVYAVLNRVLFPGDQIAISDFDPAYQVYTIKRVSVSGSLSIIEVEEEIHDTVTPSAIYYKKRFEIQSIEPVMPGNSHIYFRATGQVQAAEEMAEFITNKFFRHEGLHLVEHVLLRPKIREKAYEEMVTGQNTLITTLSVPGNLEFTKFFEVISVDSVHNMFFVDDDITADLSPLMTIRVKGSTAAINDKTYTVVTYGLSVSGDATGIQVREPIPDNTLPDNGTIYLQKTEFLSVLDEFAVAVHGMMAAEIDQESPAIITGSQDGANDGTYHISETAPAGFSTKITFDQRLILHEDHFLPINLNDDCSSCRVEDPYSFIASVVMPYWQGRFINQDFRNYFERSLRLECPAHIALNICWVSNDQMKEFELKYKTWLVENAKRVKDPALLSDALNTLIDILGRLRTVYPGGTLHDCAADDTLQNSIILNRTALGTIQL